MRIMCEVQSNNRQLSSLNLSAKKRSTLSSLAIGKQPGELKDVSNLFIHICCLQNKNGNKYKISNNIKAVFTKFINEGKFTIQLKEPSIDISVKAEPTLAKGFLKLLKLALENKNLQKLPFSHLNAVKQNQIEKPKTKLVVNTRKEYPITFPYSLETLIITGIKLNRIEKKIMNLKNLCHLDLSENQIQDIPLELSNMKSLSVLNLKGNKILTFPDHFFNYKIKETLTSLNLSDNEMTALPYSIVKLKKLNTLTLNNNKVTSIPLSINRLHNLKHLNISQNSLKVLPATVKHLLLDSFDVSGNPFDGEPGVCRDQLTGCVPSLKEVAGVLCIQNRFDPHPHDIPYTLCDYLDHHLSCVCGKIVLKSYLLGVMEVQLNRLSSAAITSIKKTVPTLGAFCSNKCWGRFQKCYRY